MLYATFQCQSISPTLMLRQQQTHRNITNFAFSVGALARNFTCRKHKEAIVLQTELECIAVRGLQQQMWNKYKTNCKKTFAS